MKKKSISLLLAITIVISIFSSFNINLFADVCNHDWSPATCTKASYCRLCGETKGTPTEHKFKTLTDGSQQCIYCRYTIAPEEVKPECKYCKIFFDTQEEYDAHMKQKHPATKPSTYTGGTGTVISKRNWDCLACGYPCGSKEGYLLHNQQAHSSLGKCSVCGASFSSYSELASHWAEAHSGAATAQAYTEIYHEYRETGKVNTSDLENSNGSFTCGNCNITFNSYSEYSEHMKIHVSQEDIDKQNGVLTCPVCGEKSSDIGWMYDHYQTHEELKTEDVTIYMCGTCGQQFNTEAERDFHQEKEMAALGLTNEYECEFCHEKFDKYGWVVHTTNHLKEMYPNVYHCNTCNKDFESEEALMEHVEEENKKAQQAVDEYNAYVERHNQEVLKQQQQIASGEILKCPVCDRLFKYAPDLYHHVADNHPDYYKSEENITVKETFTCTTCQLEFETLAKLQEHIKEHEKENHINSIVYLSKSSIPVYKYKSGRSNLDTSTIYYVHIARFRCTTCNTEFCAVVGITTNENDIPNPGKGAIYSAHQNKTNAYCSYKWYQIISSGQDVMF